MLDSRARNRFGHAALLVVLGGAAIYAGCSSVDVAGAPGGGPVDPATADGGAPDGAVGSVGLVDAGTPPDAHADYPESILCPEGVDADPRCGPGYSPDRALPDAELAAAIGVGLAAWTDPASKEGACITCHSPDGIDLAKIGYSDCDIRRRALKHVSEPQAEDIVKLVHALRQKYEVRRPLHPDKYRPFQPAYEPFGQPADDVEVVKTASQDERDEAFANYLTTDLKLTWATTKIDSLALARKAYDELVNLDLHSVKIGIPFDRFSEDPSAAAGACGRPPGAAHAGQSVFEWIPDISVAAKPGSEVAWNAVLATYRESPTTENLWKYYDAIDTLTECTKLPAGDFSHACEWMRFKYKSVQVVQHMLRHDLRLHPDQLADERAPGLVPLAHEHLATMIARSPLWETGDVIRVAPLERRGSPACFSSPSQPCTVLPPRIDQSIHSVPTHQEALINQGDLFQLSWFTMSFLNEPTLTMHSDNFATFIGDYLESAMLPRYDVHHAFIVAVMAARKAAATEWLSAPGFRQGTGKIASVRTFSFKQLRNDFSPPASGPRRAIHERMFANFARMWIYLVEDDLKTSGTVYGRDGVFGGGPTDRGGLLSAVRFMREWIGELEGAEDPAINAGVVSIEALAASATELRTQENYESENGLQPTGRWADYQTPYAP